MMLPARTGCPPNFFTPRRLLSLSRPLRDEPPAFLCAMTNYFARLFGLWGLLGAALSRCSIFCEGGLGRFAAGCWLLGALRIFRSDFHVALGLRIGLRLVVRSRIFGRRAGDLARLLL